MTEAVEVLSDNLRLCIFITFYAAAFLANLNNNTEVTFDEPVLKIGILWQATVLFRLFKTAAELIKSEYDVATIVS